MLNSAQAYTVLDFLSNRSERQKEARGHITEAIQEYDVHLTDSNRDTGVKVSALWTDLFTDTLVAYINSAYSNRKVRVLNFLCDHDYVDAVHSLGTAIDIGGKGTSLQERQYTLAGYFLVNNGTSSATGCAPSWVTPSLTHRSWK